MSAKQDRKLISIVTPCFNEDECLEECYSRVKEVFETQLPDYDYEHIFCDNRSSDNTVPILRRLAKDHRVKVILNSRNFGPLPSTFNGIMAASGDAVMALLPADLQDPPELLPQFVREWEAGNEIVYGLRTDRAESVTMTTFRKIYYKLVRWASFIDIPENAGSFQLIDRKVVDALAQFTDYYPHIPNMIASCGFNSKAIPYSWEKRYAGETKNKIKNLVHEALNSLISYSHIAIRLCLACGVGSLVASVFTMFGALILKFFIPGHEETSLLFPAIFLLASVQMLIMGIIGEYVSAIHYQVRKRPLVIESERINFG